MNPKDWKIINNQIKNRVKFIHKMLFEEKFPKEMPPNCLENLLLLLFYFYLQLNQGKNESNISVFRS